MNMNINPIVMNLYRHFYSHPNDKNAEKIVMFHHKHSVLIHGESSWEAFQKFQKSSDKKRQSQIIV